MLTRGLGAEPATLDPQLAEDNAALALATDLYEGLTISQRDGSTAPGAAESWSVSNDGLTYEFRLRRDLRWSDGNALTAGHFATSLLALAAPGSTAPNAGLFAAIVEVTATDERQLRIRLARPLPHLPALLALPAAAPRYPGRRSDALPPGNGAFRLVARTIGERIVLERNPPNWNAAAVALADLWRSALGVETRIVELEWTVYLDTRRAPGDCDLVRLGWSADFVDPEAFAVVFESASPQNTTCPTLSSETAPARSSTRTSVPVVSYRTPLTITLPNPLIAPLTNTAFVLPVGGNGPAGGVAGPPEESSPPLPPQAATSSDAAAGRINFRLVDCISHL